MQNPDGQDSGSQGSKKDDEAFSWTGILHPHKSDAADGEQQHKKKRYEAAKTYLKRLGNAGPSKHIELLLATMIGLFAGGQWITSCHNNDTTSEQTSQLIASARINAFAAQQNALAAGSFANSAQYINQGISDAVDKLNLQAAEMAESASQAERLARSTETATQHSLQADRAWVAVQNLHIVSLPHDGRLNITFELINSGNTPAMHVQYAIGKLDNTHIVAAGLNPELNEKTIEKAFRNTAWDFKDLLIMAPQAKVPISFESPDSISEMTYQEIMFPQVSFFVLGRVSYKDVRDKDQWENICFQIYRTNSGLESNPVFSWKYCASGNKMSYDSEKYREK